MSVIIPCYNQGRYLPEAIDSVLGQTYPRYEIIVVNDGATDHTADVVRRYPTVRYLPQSNQGLPAARNAGLRAARGGFIVFLDADDRLLPSHFATSLAAFEKQPHVDMVFGATYLFGTVSRLQHLCDGSNSDMFAQLLRANIVHAPHAAMYKSSLFARVGEFCTELKAAEDYEFYLRIARIAAMSCHHETVAEYRCHAEQMSKKYQTMLECNVRVLRMQRPYLRGSAEHVNAYDAGIRRVRSAYGAPLVWQIMPALRRGDWRQAGAALRTLLKCHPAALLLPLQHKFSRKPARAVRS